MAERFAAAPHILKDIEPDYNVSPGKQVYVIAARPPHDGDPVERQLRTMRWGLVPSWAKDPKIGNRLINARVETAGSRPAFRAAMIRRRCVIPADGYYEWYQPRDASASGAALGRRSSKQPFYIHGSDGSELALAGLYEIWRDPSVPGDDPGHWLWTCVILTTDADAVLSRIHARAPLIIPDDALDAWLDPGIHEPPDVVLRGDRSSGLEAVAVSTAVNNVRNNGPDLIRAIPHE